tara:strand:- start:255 stop:1373 length:1119 start_codon:yes stop_codon:yes gene_type:complete
MTIEKGPTCRQATETYNECVSRKISELIEIDGMEQPQAVAVAQSMCEKACASKAASVSTGQFVSWSTDKGRYVGQVSSVITSGNVSVVSSSGGQEQVEASADKPVARVVVYVNNQDGSYTRSDRSVPVRVAMLRIIKEPETKQVSASVRKTLSEKAKKHNEKYDSPTKKTSTRTLVAVFRRGVGAYRNNPQSVRPTVNSAEQWAFARVNSFLYVLRTGRFRGGKHDQDLLPKGHPQSSKSLDKSEHVTNFPKRGDNLAVSIRNSEHDTFPLAYAENLKENHPDIWRRGGNILGNTQFNRLQKVMSQNGTPKTPTDERAIRLREAWGARHKEDYRLAGVVAQVKWLVVGSRGISHMKRVINEAKKGVFDEEGD